MTETAISKFLASPTARDMPKGVLTLIFCEDEAYLDSTLANARAQSPAHICCIGRTGHLETSDGVTVIPADLASRFARDAILNQIIDRFDGRWLHWLNNGEFFFFPWCESRTIGDLAGFLTDERRRLAYSYAFDLYAAALPEIHADPRDHDLWMDIRAFHAFPDEKRRLAVFGGLGWRFEECFQPWWQQIGRASLFRAQKGLHIGRDMVFAEDEFVSVSAPWHNSPTGAVMGLRRTRHLFSAPAFVDLQDRLLWSGSERFNWHSSQLLDLGMIEPGQWF